MVSLQHAENSNQQTSAMRNDCWSIDNNARHVKFTTYKKRATIDRGSAVVQDTFGKRRSKYGRRWYRIPILLQHIGKKRYREKEPLMGTSPSRLQVEMHGRDGEMIQAPIYQKEKRVWNRFSCANTNIISLTAIRKQSSSEFAAGLNHKTCKHLRPPYTHAEKSLSIDL